MDRHNNNDIYIKRNIVKKYKGIKQFLDEH